jgi:NDP-sugar pyrophosphorylase family protein
MYIQTGNTDVVLLCGGLGTRLQSIVNDRPKPMAMVNKRPFLEILIDQFQDQGFKRFILCTGHLSMVVRAYFKDRRDLDIIISEEPAALGTAGAVKNAASYIQSDPFIVTNGDSYCEVDLKGFLEFHLQKSANMSMVVASTDNACDYGTVKLGSDQQILSFTEKHKTIQQGLISAGIYIFNRNILGQIPDKIKCSLENDIFPDLAGNRSYGFKVTAEVLDIGTPERFARAQDNFTV